MEEIWRIKPNAEICQKKSLVIKETCLFILRYISYLFRFVLIFVDWFFFVWFPPDDVRGVIPVLGERDWMGMDATVTWKKIAQ